MQRDVAMVSPPGHHQRRGEHQPAAALADLRRLINIQTVDYSVALPIREGFGEEKTGANKQAQGKGSDE